MTKTYLLRHLLTALISVSCVRGAVADLYGPGPGGAIPDATMDNTAGSQGVLTSTISASNVASPTIASLNGVELTFTSHSWVGDLVAILTAPNGDNVHLFSRVGADMAGASFGDTSNLAGLYRFENTGASFAAAAAAVDTMTAVPPGTYARSSNAGAIAPAADPDDYSVFVGDNLNGTWTLKIEDWAVLETGTLTSWCLDITSITSVPEARPLVIWSAVGLVVGVAALVRRRGAVS